MRDVTLPPSPNWYGPQVMAGDRWSTIFAYCSKSQVVLMDANSTVSTVSSDIYATSQSQTGMGYGSHTQISSSLGVNSDIDEQPQIRPRMIATLSGHSDRVACLDFNPHPHTHTLLASGSEDKHVYIWNTQLSMCVHTYTRVCDSGVVAVAWSAFDSAELLALDQTGTLVLIHVESSAFDINSSTNVLSKPTTHVGNMSGPMHMNSNSVSSIYTNTISKSASASANSGIHTVCKKSGAATCMAVSRNAAMPTLVAVGYKKGSVVVYNTAKGCVMHRLSGHVDEIQSLSWKWRYVCF
ncbi:hypothetical protein SARC_05746 [Sphaeroforma arctica JP610]|uniref:Uncharacterized protein n=1 Tax=Sphaeroforma arctica JP610 TaxID=667725 RepID=A0A0L0FZ93_9EUKA|nr:hypothetical protein SARC_05746 [Sphaeroforma arctica JP610]KNC81954.1 hypothetical protein SARC_05746 [Sphaeroforma arctica JP610]|eukprot:XP_014155856.1 hypothetical protein SARC_05746 [Sphaeroforma arctica JP610]